MSIRHSSETSVSSQFAALRRLLLGPGEGVQQAIGSGKGMFLWQPSRTLFKVLPQGQIPLVVEAYSADIIAILVILKQEVERSTKRNMRLTITGGAEPISWQKNR